MSGLSGLTLRALWCAVLCCAVLCVLQLVYIILRRRFPQLDRGFRSPLGPAGAVVGIAVFTLCLTGIAGFSTAGWRPWAGITLWFAGFMLYYWLYAQHRNKLSPEEHFCLYMVLPTAYRALSSCGWAMAVSILILIC